MVVMNERMDGPAMLSGIRAEARSALKMPYPDATQVGRGGSGLRPGLTLPFQHGNRNEDRNRERLIEKDVLHVTIVLYYTPAHTPARGVGIALPAGTFNGSPASAGCLRGRRREYYAATGHF